MTTKDSADGFKYWAFISYSSKDRDVAKKLHKRLESYKIPKDLRGRPGRDGAVPDRLFPVFRDRDELPLSSDLGSTIYDALKASRYLVVLCSPNAAGSRWVNEEIKTFKAMGREDRILALILDGEPGATEMAGREAEEAFPEALRFRVTKDGEITDEPCEPIGGDLRKGGDGWTRSFLKAVAGITGLGFDSFARREAKRARRRRALAGVLGLSVLVACVCAWDYYRVKTDYYRYLTFQYGEPVGLGEVSEGAAGHRNWTFRVESSKRKPRRVVVQNALGGMRDLPAFFTEFESFSRLDVTYRENGRVSSHSYFNAKDSEVLRLDFSEDLKIVSRKMPGKNTAAALDSSGGSIASAGWFAPLEDLSNYYKDKVDVSSYEFLYDERGFVDEIYFLNAYGVASSNREELYGLKFVRGGQGEVLEMHSLGRNGEPVNALNTEVSQVHLELDENFDEMSKWLTDSDGKRVNGPAGFCEMKIERDGYGNDFVRAFYNAKGEAEMRNNAHHKTVVKFDDVGNNVDQAFYGTRGEPATFKNMGAHAWRSTFEGCEEKTLTSYGVDGEPVLDVNGVFEYQYENDANGRNTRQVFLGLNGEPAYYAESGAHSHEFEYEGRHFAKEIRYYGGSGEAIISKYGYHRAVYEYNRSGQSISERFFDVKGKAMLKFGRYHERKMEYDNQGNMRVESYWGLDKGEKSGDEKGVHAYITERDGSGRMTRQSYVGLDGRKMVHPEHGYAEASYAYLNNGLREETRYWDASGAKCVGKHGVHLEVGELNSFGKAERFLNYDVDGKPCFHLENGYHRTVLEYDGEGNLVAQKYFGVKEGGKEKVVIEGGFHEYRYVTNELGLVTEKGYYGLNGEEVSNRTSGYHRWVKKFDSHRREVSVSYWLPGGVLGFTGESASYHRADTAYDARGKAKSFTYYKNETELVDGGKAAAKKAMKYDALGNVVEYAFYSAVGELVSIPSIGYALERRVVLPDGKLKEVSYFDEKDEPTLSGLYHRYENTYDALGNVVWLRFYGKDGKRLVLDGKGYAGFQRSYDEFGYLTEERYVGVEDEPVAMEGALYRVAFAVDRLGRRTERKFYGPDDEKIFYGSDNVFETRWKYHQSGDLAEESFWDGDGKPMICADGYHTKTISERILRSSNIVKEVRGIDGERVINLVNMVHQTVEFYDKEGRATRVEYRGLDGELKLSKFGYAVILSDYDELGRMKGNRYLGVDDDVRYESDWLYAEGSFVVVKKIYRNAEGKVVKEEVL